MGANGQTGSVLLEMAPAAHRWQPSPAMTSDGKMSLVYRTADDVPGERAVLMGSGQPVQTPEETIAAFRKFYPGKADPTIEQCIVHQWWKEEPTCVHCERHAFPFGQL